MVVYTAVHFGTEVVNTPVDVIKALIKGLKPVSLSTISRWVILGPFQPQQPPRGLTKWPLNRQK
jgi:hypothetical protein